MSLSHPSMLLVAAARLSEATDTFTVEDLTAMAFALYPEVFALRGHPRFPDHHKVLSRLAGACGLVARGLLERGEGAVRLTPEGIVQAKACAGQGAKASHHHAPPEPARRPPSPRPRSPTAVASPPRLSPSDTARVRTLAFTHLAQRYLRGEPRATTAPTREDAEGFWGTLGAHSPDAIGDLLDRALAFVQGPGVDRTLPPFEVVRKLHSLHRLLCARAELWRHETQPGA